MISYETSKFHVWLKRWIPLQSARKKLWGLAEDLSWHESYAWHKSWTNESDAQNKSAMSLKLVHRRVPTVPIQAESFGALQLSLGKTAPLRYTMDSLIFNSSSGKEGG
ncbi:hypothetical protein LR48_Vigan721s001100 [Vigna angularis]|uniref:Uncharacterized protein n=1 Tax=Phaseolus angularis TaxID=3914 RepID=A0A0L9THB2_PHAAN|nr:hypothetical protein LR48_Vigan721s001100 [Vigna angularis]